MKGKVIVAIQFLLLGLMVLVPGSGDANRSTLIVGTLVIIAGAGLVAKSFRDLGDSLTALPESKAGATLITTGIYAKIRHPIYSALFLISIGFLIVKQSMASALVFFLLNMLLWYKSNYEDRILIAKFPEAAAYQKSTPAFIPTFKKRA